MPKLRPMIAALFAAIALTFSMPAFAQAIVLSGKAESCANQQAYTPIAKRYERGLIFKLEKCGYPTNYIMGTMHSDSNRVAPIYQDAVAILPALQRIGFEFVEDDKTASTAQQYMMLPATYAQGLKDIIGDESFTLLSRELESRMKLPPAATNRMRPWAVAVTLQYPAPETDGITLDKRLQQRAQAMQKTLFGLETPAEQFQVFDNLPFGKQLIMLNDTLDAVDTLDENNEDFMKTYVARDLNALHALADESFDMTTDPWLRDYLREHLLVKRNKLMAKRMLPHLRAGNALVAVGALHLMGEDGILPLLEQQGWRVEVVR